MLCIQSYNLLYAIKSIEKMIDTEIVAGMLGVHKSLRKANKVDFSGFPKTLLKIFSSVMVILFFAFISLAAIFSTQNNNYVSYVIIGVAVFWVFFIFFINLILDFIYGLIDPDRKLFKGEKLFRNSKYQAAIQLLKPLANRGNVDAQNILGYIYQIQI